MKRIGLSLLTLFLALLFTAETFANGPLFPMVKHATKDVIEKCYLDGITSDNEGVRASAAMYLGYMKSEKAVLPLMKMLRDEKTEESRIVAALALIRIGDAQGVYMVGRTAQFNTSLRVQRVADKFYNAFTNGKIEEVPQYPLYSN
jgi:hypothetical protein